MFQNLSLHQLAGSKLAGKKAEHSTKWHVSVSRKHNGNVGKLVYVTFPSAETQKVAFLVICRVSVAFKLPKCIKRVSVTFKVRKLVFKLVSMV